MVCTDAASVDPASEWAVPGRAKGLRLLLWCSPVCEGGTMLWPASDTLSWTDTEPAVTEPSCDSALPAVACISITHTSDTLNERT